MNKKIVLLIIASVLLIGTDILRVKNNNSLPFYEQYKDDSLLNNLNLSSMLSVRLILFFLGIINVWLVYTFFEKLSKDAFLITLLWVLSPMFFYFHNSYTIYAFSFPFFMLGLILVFSSRPFLSLFLFIISCILTQNMFLIVLLALFVLLEKQKKKIFFSYLGIIAVAYLFAAINNPGTLDAHKVITESFSDLGADFGIGIFPFLLGIIGIIISWKDKKTNFIFYFIASCLGVLSLFDKAVLLFFNMILVYYSASGITYLAERKWDSEILKTYVIIIFMCGIIFSAGSYVKKVSEYGPNQEELISFGALRDEGKVFSHYKYGHLIKKMSGLEAYTDFTYFKQSKNKEKIVFSEEIFSSRDYKKIEEFFLKNEIKYVWINKEMKSGLVWKTEDEGMLFVLKNNFKKIYEYKSVEIWELPK